MIIIKIIFEAIKMGLNKLECYKIMRKKIVKVSKILIQFNI